MGVFDIYTVCEHQKLLGGLPCPRVSRIFFRNLGALSTIVISVKFGREAAKFRDMITFAKFRAFDLIRAYGLLGEPR